MISHRAFQKEDVQLVRDLLRENFARTQHPFLTIDLPNWERMWAARELETGRQQIHLWEVVGRKPHSLVAMLLYHPVRGESSWLVLPEYQELEDEMIQQAEQRHRTEQSKLGVVWPLKCTVCESSFHQRACLTKRGYAELEVTVLFRKRGLDITVPNAAPPPGYAIRNLANATDQTLTERAAIENQVFGRSLAATMFRKLQVAPLYRPALDLMMMASDEAPAAFGTAWFDSIQQIGFFEPLGTLEAHRQRGLAKVLILDGFRRLQGLGATAVYLGHASSNTAAHRLYQSVGMEVFDREVVWQRKLE